MQKINFASDNYVGVHPAIMDALVKANKDPAPAYGDDNFSSAAIKRFQEILDPNCEVFFVCNGTAANVTSIATVKNSFQAVICSDVAHIQVDECGAIEKFIGSKLLLVPNRNGKITVAEIEKHLERLHDQHHVQPKMISISQVTEYGSVYTPQEIRAIADFAHKNHMYLHMDGARISNAAASLQVKLAQITKEVGVDVLSFGGTKNGMMFGEAVVIFNKQLAEDFKYIRKQAMQLISKMRFLAVQFCALLNDDLWLQNAMHANAMAQLLAAGLAELGIPFKPVESNVVFAILPQALQEKLAPEFYFYSWREINEVRLMTSFATTKDEIAALLEAIRRA